MVSARFLERIAFDRLAYGNNSHPMVRMTCDSYRPHCPSTTKKRGDGKKSSHGKLLNDLRTLRPAVCGIPFRRHRTPKAWQLLELVIAVWFL